AIQLLKELIKIDSVNPSLVQGAKGEKEIAEYIAGWLKSLGLKTRIDEVIKGRYNTVGILEGTGEGKSLMLNGHTDTVGYDYMTIDPLKPTIKNGKLYGRGSVDMKGGLAASLSAVKAIVDSGIKLEGNLVVAAVCDEEYASIGTEHLMQNTKVDTAIVGEPSDLQILRCHKGFAWVKIETKGLAAHGSLWQSGVDAITKMGKVLNGIEELDKNLKKTYHELTGPASIHSSLIEGGLGLSTYPDKCVLQVERRLIPSETIKDVEQEFQTMLEKIKQLDPKFNAEYEITFHRNPMDVPAESEICKTIIKASEKALGFKPAFIGGSAWLDTQIIWEKGIPAVVYGPSGEGAHAAVEWVDLQTVIDAAKVQELTIREFCGIKT
ncbi:MAG: ArgE/DapE family deacylase, partial [Candidatus Delongbacteria bacterium]|nr:ArgE/DapE family deacylase [Candidatus Delongbacteria bacterium]